jgi:uncharacterized membrane protein (UPF0127 family)
MSRLSIPYQEINEFQLFHKDYPPKVARMFASHGETVLSSENREKEPIKLKLEIADEDVILFQGASYHEKFRGKKGLLYHVERCFTQLTWRGQKFNTDLLLFDEMGKCIRLMPYSNSNPNLNNVIKWNCAFAIELNAGFIKRNKVTLDFYLDIAPFCEWGDREHPFEIDFLRAVQVKVKEKNDEA